jgi:hypothetical protein
MAKAPLGKTAVRREVPASIPVGLPLVFGRGAFGPVPVQRRPRMSAILMFTQSYQKVRIFWGILLFALSHKPPDDDHAREHIMDTSLVRAYQRNQKYGREHRTHIKQHRMHGGVEKRHSGAVGQTHFEIHRTHARRCHAIARDRETVLEKRNGRKEGWQNEKRKPQS